MDQTALPCLDIGMPDKARAERLRLAVKRAGGNQAVAARAAVPIGTLNNYLAGRDPKVGAFVALAAACQVSLEWLATGNGPERPAWYRPEIAGSPHLFPEGATRAVPNPDYEAPPPAPPPAGGLSEGRTVFLQPTPIDPDALAQAIEIVRGLDGDKALQTPSKDLAARLATAYNILAGIKS